MDKIITLEELLNKHFKIINEAVENTGGFVAYSIPPIILAQPQQPGQPLQPGQPVAPLGGIFHVQSPKLIGSGNKFIRFIGAGGFGCVFSPPKLITPIVIQEYPPNDKIDIDSDQYDDKYVAKILSCEKNAYKKEFASNMLIEIFDNDGNYTPKMIFAGYMDSEAIMDSIQDIQKTDKELYECLHQKFKKNNHDYYGYIISTRVGKPFDNLTTDDINESNIKDVLTSFSKGIKIFINNLYEQGYLHGDIKTPNMTIKDNNIYFIDFGLTDKYNKTLTDKNNNTYPIVLTNSTNQNYPIILHLFSIVYVDQLDTFKTNKAGYLELFNNRITQPVSELNPYFFAVNNLITSHKYSIFTNIEDVKTYLKKYIKQLLDDNLDDNEEYSIKEVYEICFLPIAKNVDIYSLSLVMFHLFYNNIYQRSITLSNYVSDETLELISKLFEAALYNQIKHPNDLADRLDNIIVTIK
jgi:hypothetical protein